MWRGHAAPYGAFEKVYLFGIQISGKSGNGIAVLIVQHPHVTVAVKAVASPQLHM